MLGIIYLWIPVGYDKARFDRRVQEILDLDRLGLPIADELVSEVRSAGADDLLYNATQREDYEAKDNYDGRKHLWLYRTPEKRKDEPNYYDRVPQEWKDKWAGVDITRAHWLPEGAPEEITDELRRFVSSGNPRFDKLLAYEPFYLYCEQARRWRAEDGRIEDCKSEGEQEAFAMQEFARARDNKLYGLDKYATIKDEVSPGGRRDYKASTPQALLMFLKDCGFSYILLKGRQAAITSTMMAAAQLTALVTPSYKGALVVDKEKTGFNIFNDKFKSTYQFMPDWWKPEVEGNWSNKTVLLDFDPGERKSDKRRFTAEFSTYPASDPQTINASTPTETYFDEAQKMSTLQDILGELRPTMLANIDDELRILRAAFVWGCVCAGTKVWTNAGDFVNIEDLDPKQGILGYDGSGVSREPITYWQPPAKKPCYRITTNTGRFLECSEDHPILYRPKAKNNPPPAFREAKDISPTDRVAVIDSAPIYGSKTMWEPRLVGWLIGDGTYGHDKVPRLANCDAEINDYVYSVTDAVTTRSHVTKDGRIYKESTLRGTGKHLRDIGIFGQTRNNKRLPIDIHSYRKKDICELLGGIFDTDGSVNDASINRKGASRNINLTSSCYELLNEVRFLLQKVGVHCNIKKIRANPSTNPKDRNDWYVLYICQSRSLIRFRDEIGFFVSYKREKLDRVISDNAIRSALSKNGQRKTVPGISFERVTKVEYIGVRDIYNLTAGNTHTYIANGIVTHNTGGSGDAGKGMFEAEFNGVFSMLEQRQDTDGWFAIFFDAFCRPGMDEKRYRKEYAKYMKGDVKGVDFRGMSHEQKESLFAAHYPMNPADCFMSSTRTVVPSIIIKSQRDKIISTPEPLLPKKGRFEPVYDQKQPQPEGSFLPFKLTGAKWIPAKPHEYDAPVSMFMPPHNDWADRYVQGTDPIQSDTGQSRMGSAIWDGAGRILETAHGKLFVPTVACTVNYRTHKPKETFLQCVLMGMHYHNYGQKKCRELVEMEQGHNYMTFQDDTAVDTGDYLIYPGELMPAFHGGQMERGISMKKERKSRAHIELQELCFDHLHNIYHMDFINQLSSIETEERQDGSVAFSTKDVRRSNDDVVMAVLFSYIAWKSLSLVPKKIGSKDAPVTIRRTVAQRRADGSLGWVEVDTPMEYA